jgi:ankyrin repeat protein
LLLLKEGVDPNSKDRFDQTALLLAAAIGHVPVAKLLLATDRISVNSRDNHALYSQAPLGWPAKNGQEAMVKILLATDGVKMNCTDNQGKTPLQLAEKAGHEAVARVLISYT